MRKHRRVAGFRIAALRARAVDINVMVIATTGSPEIKNPQDLSPALLNFLEECLRLQAEDRPNAGELLEHEFLKGSLASDEEIKKLLSTAK